ncbi:hypothetical protein PCANC_03566 [Puccinia coronata f. sp. avenae]|uniref:Uncharacterized protein n=1 Tax=Puccinia coronata f. sp. avenae TaxID=200324 RepID=A0A2N5VV26_9BASI|nr:hypothetical protein PCANC_03566 [Puccinia coronata f. sp. avenae]
MADNQSKSAPSPPSPQNSDLACTQAQIPQDATQLPFLTSTSQKKTKTADRHDRNHPSYAYHNASPNQSTSLPNNSSSSSIPTVQPPPNFLPMPFPPNKNPPYQYSPNPANHHNPYIPE